MPDKVHPLVKLPWRLASPARLFGRLGWSLVRREIEPRLARIEAGLGQIASRQADWRAEVVALANRQEATDDFVSKLDERSRDHFEEIASRSQLFLCAVPDGLFVLKLRDKISDAMLCDRGWHRHVLAVSDYLAERGRNGHAIDVGAHFGTMTVPLARRFAKVISFEPNAFSASLLRANVALNGLNDTVVIHRYGLLDRRTRISLAGEKVPQIATTRLPDNKLDAAIVENMAAYSFSTNGIGIFDAPAGPLDDYGFSDVSFLKIGTQGADGLVIKGGLATIERCRPWIVFEWEKGLYQPFEASLTDTVALLEHLDYVVMPFNQHNANQVAHLAVPKTDEEAARKLCT